MNFITSIFRNTPGKIVLYGWVYPFMALLVIASLFALSGCQGGWSFVDTFPIQCDFDFLLGIFVLVDPIAIYAAFYFVASLIVFGPLFIVALIRAIRGNPTV